MADKSKKHRSNVDGKYYVDENCIDCDLCRETAPNNFARQEDVDADGKSGYSFVKKQPENEKEREDCESARNDCPVSAIGDNG